MSVMRLATRSSGVGSKYGFQHGDARRRRVPNLGRGALPDDQARGNGVAHELVAARHHVYGQPLLRRRRREHARAALVEKPLRPHRIRAHEHRICRREGMPDCRIAEVGDRSAGGGETRCQPAAFEGGTPLAARHADRPRASQGIEDREDGAAEGQRHDSQRRVRCVSGEAMPLRNARAPRARAPRAGRTVRIARARALTPAPPAPHSRPAPCSAAPGKGRGRRA